MYNVTIKVLIKELDSCNDERKLFELDSNRQESFNVNIYHHHQ